MGMDTKYFRESNLYSSVIWNGQMVLSKTEYNECALNWVWFVGVTITRRFFWLIIKLLLVELYYTNWWKKRNFNHFGFTIANVVFVLNWISIIIEHYNQYVVLSLSCGERVIWWNIQYKFIILLIYHEILIH